MLTVELQRLPPAGAITRTMREVFVMIYLCREIFTGPESYGLMTVFMWASGALNQGPFTQQWYPQDRTVGHILQEYGAIREVCSYSTRDVGIDPDRPGMVFAVLADLLMWCRGEDDELMNRLIWAADAKQREEQRHGHEPPSSA